MAGRYPEFDRSRLLIKPLDQRTNDLQRPWWLGLDAEVPEDQFRAVAEIIAYVWRLKAR